MRNPTSLLLTALLLLTTGCQSLRSDGRSQASHETTSDCAFDVFRTEERGNATTLDGVLDGVVRDCHGRPLRHVNVELLNISLASPRLTLTDEEGRFAFPRTPAMKYTVRVTLFPRSNSHPDNGKYSTLRVIAEAGAVDHVSRTTVTVTVPVH